MARQYAKFVSLIVLVIASVTGNGQQGCTVKNTAFKSGEKVTYRIYYHWHFIWLSSGQVTFSVALKKYYSLPAYYLTGYGSTYPKYDWFYKVRDTFLTYVDTATLASLRFKRITNEGSTHVSNDNVFDNVHHKVYCLSKDKANKYREDSLHIPPCTYDVLAGIYCTRNLDFSAYNINDTIPLTLYLDAHTYRIHLTYLGKETVTSSLGKYRCIKFNVSLISGTIFKPGAQMTVWVTDDLNRIPIYIEAPITVGSVRAELESFSNLRNPTDAKVK